MRLTWPLHTRLHHLPSYYAGCQILGHALEHGASLVQVGGADAKDILHMLHRFAIRVLLDDAQTL